MRSPTHDEFYIGYEPSMPPGLRRAVRRAVICAIAVALLTAATATLAQRPLAPAAFDYTRAQAVAGWLVLAPTPTLLVPAGSGVVRYWLVGPGKFGADGLLRDHSDGWVHLEGKRIAREQWQMLEVVPGSVRRGPTSMGPPAVAPLTRTAFSARGEIVDSKCFLGVMNPGEHGAHRDCAVRCLSGGVPPLFAYRDRDGSTHLALLLAPGAARPDERWTRLAGTAIELEGELLVRGDEEVLLVERP